MLPLLMFLAFLLLPVAEIYVIIQVGELIGGWPTAALLLAESLLGVWIVRREGRRAWQALHQTLDSGVLPGRELIDAALIMIGGVLLLTPGFVTDVFGFVFVLPFTRPVARHLLALYGARRLRTAERRAAAGMFGPGFPPNPGFPPSADTAPGRPFTGPVIRGEVIDDDRTGS